MNHFIGFKEMRIPTVQIYCYERSATIPGKTQFVDSFRFFLENARKIRFVISSTSEQLACQTSSILKIVFMSSIESMSKLIEIEGC